MRPIIRRPATDNNVGSYLILQSMGNQPLVFILRGIWSFDCVYSRTRLSRSLMELSCTSRGSVVVSVTVEHDSTHIVGDSNHHQAVKVVKPSNNQIINSTELSNWWVIQGLSRWSKGTIMS